MERTRFFILALIFLHLLVFVSTLQHDCADNGAVPEVRAGYWLSSASHYSPLSSIDASLYTHLYYSSLSIDETNYTVSLPSTDGRSMLGTFSSTVKSIGNSAVKTILSISTDEYKVDVSNAAFSRMAADKNLREVFISSSIEVARANGFDGLDLAWNLPATEEDMANLGDLLAEWRATIIEESGNSSSEPLLLTATVYFSNHMFDTPDSNLDYPIHDISTNLDWANVLTFGFHKNSNITATDAALYDMSSHFSASYGVISWLDAGVPPCKLVMGIPLFGRSWFLKSDSTVVTYDNQSVAEYFYSGDLWVGFDSARVVEKKIDFAAKYMLLGYFLWTISFDDSNSWLPVTAAARNTAAFNLAGGRTGQWIQSSAAATGNWGIGRGTEMGLEQPEEKR